MKSRNLRPVSGFANPPHHHFSAALIVLIKTMVNGILKKVTQQVQCQVTINTLSDDALLYVFDFYVAQASDVETWHTLVHVCRRWRTLVFASPRRLNLRTTSREKLDVWPALPIVVSNYYRSTTRFIDNNIKAALGHHDRVYQINLRVSSPSELAEVFAALEAPFPVLTDLDLLSIVGPNPILPNPAKFLSGSTHLRSLSFHGIPVPILPELLLSSTSLRVIDLNAIRVTGFFSPRAMVNALTVLTKLEVLHIGFEVYEGEFDRLHRDWESQRLPLPPRAILPSLTALKFEGFSEYLEDLMAWIDAPLLDHLDIAYTCFYSDSDIELDTTQLFRFMSRIPKFQAPDKAHMGIDSCLSKFWIKFSWPKRISSAVRLAVYCPYAERQMSRLVQFCHSPFFPLPTLENLHICEGLYSPRYRQAYTRWLELFQPFTAVKNLYLSEDYARRIAPVLQELVGERTMEVLPTLEKVFIQFCPSRRVHEIIEQFAAARQLSGHPIVIYHWDGRQQDGESR